MIYRDPPNFALDIVVPPTDEPIQLGEAMEHLNISFDDRHHDGWLNWTIPTARRYCEGWLGRTLAPQTLELAFGGYARATTVPTYWQPLGLNPWPDSGSFIELPYGPVLTVESVTYRDGAGDLQTMDESLYVFEGGKFASISLASGASWPTVQARRNAIQIRYVAGYTLPDESPSIYPLPPEFKSAMLLMLGHLFDNREATIAVPGGLQQIPLGIASLLDLSPAGRLRMGMA